MTSISRDADLCNVSSGVLKDVNIPGFNYATLRPLLTEFCCATSSDQKRAMSMRCIETTLLPCSSFFLMKPHRSLIQTKHLKESSRTLKNVEDAVISLDANYREHFTHQLRVFLTGLCILSNDADMWIEKTKKYEADRLNQVFIPYIHGAQGVEEILREFFNWFVGDELSDSALLKEWWALTSLMHDMGYPPVNLQLVIGRKLGEMYSGLFAYYKFKELELIPREYLDRQMDEFMESIAFVYPDVPELLTFLDSLRSESDHGLISAIISFPKGILSDILRDVEKIRSKFESQAGFMLDMMAGFHAPLFGEAIPKSIVSEYEEMNRFFRCILYVQALLCISLHNKPYFYFASPMLQMLIASDNLQEWNRTENQGPEVQMEKKGAVLEFTFTYADREPASRFYDKLVKSFDYSNDESFKSTARFHDVENPSKFMEGIQRKIDNSLETDFRFVVMHKEGGNLTEIRTLFICNKCGNMSTSHECSRCQES